MKKVVIVSDIHRRKENLERVISFNSDADFILSCGDNELAYSYLLKKNVIAVKGNYPMDAGVGYDHIINIESIKIHMTHGHRYGVKSDLLVTSKKALEHNCDISLYGHTHQAFYGERYGVTVINPGSITSSRCHLPETYVVLIVKNDQFTYEFRNAYTNEVIPLEEVF